MYRNTCYASNQKRLNETFFLDWLPSYSSPLLCSVFTFVYFYGSAPMAKVLINPRHADIAAFFAAEKYATEEASNPQNASLVALGKEKSASCAACHGAAGIAANPMWPTLAGQHPSYIINALESYTDGRRNDPTMKGMAAGLNADDRKALAAYFASLSGGVQSLKMPEKIK